MDVHIVNSLSEYEALEDTIAESLGLPMVLPNGHKITRYLQPPELVREPGNNRYYVVKDSVTQNYVSDFERLPDSFISVEEFPFELDLET